MTKDLNSLAVATLITGIVMVDGFEGVYEAAAWIMGFPVYTHELGDVVERIKERVVAVYPTFPTEIHGTWEATRLSVLLKFGHTLSMPQGTDERTADPLSTLAAAIARAKGRGE